MFLELDKKKKDKVALVDSEQMNATYGDILDFGVLLKEIVKERTLIFVLNNNSLGSAMGYLGIMINRIVPLMLAASMDRVLLDELMNVYHPAYIWKPSDMVKDGEEIVFESYAYALVATGLTPYPLYEDLSLLLTTSGSTGSPKLVRHSYNNLEAQARNISAFFEMDGTEKPMVDLPINYTMGLSVLNSHLYAGATALLTALNPISPKYWEFLKSNEATTLTNVPYYYEILKKLRFFRMDLPSLKIISQGGGRLNDELYKECAEYAHNTGRKFIPTYGQTEGTARMAYLPAELAREKCGSIGRAIPNGKLYVVDEEGNEITTPGVIGEMVYEGPNVTLGYAQQGEDLALGDERHGILYTGDMVKTDEDGCFYIVGRKKRFLKLWGYRVGLDECENIIKSEFDVECACVGNDECMRIYVTAENKLAEIKKYIATKTNINSSAFQMYYMEKLPRSEAGKILYSKLQ